MVYIVVYTYCALQRYNKYPTATPIFRKKCGTQFVTHRRMEKSSNTNLANQTLMQMRYASRAILFLRLFIGGVMLLHVVGKMQTYSNLVIDYPSYLGLSSATTLALTIIFQSLLAAFIMIGIGTRICAAIMFLANLLSVVGLMQVEAVAMDTLKVDFLYLGIYATLIISGSGIYGFNVPWQGNSPK